MFGNYSLNKIKWSLRKLRLPIPKNALVLEIGSGANPHPMSDILVEKFLSNEHRYENCVADRPLILSDGCKMPFRDKAFDYIIAFHVLEHIKNPTAFLNEIQRVGKAGYIETPSVMFDILDPYEVHVLQVAEDEHGLSIRKRTGPKSDFFINDLDLIRKSPEWRKLFYDNPSLFHVCYHWIDKIFFKVVNPEQSLDWSNDTDNSICDNSSIEQKTRLSSLRSIVLRLIRNWNVFKKSRKINLSSLFVCPECKGNLIIKDDNAFCSACDLKYSLKPVPDFVNPRKG